MPTTMTAAGAAVSSEDHRVILNDVSWADFELILQIRGDRAGVRLTYLNGVLERSDVSLTSAMRWMENEETPLYTIGDLKALF